MMFPKLGIINNNQKGVTAMELLVAFAVTSILTGGITSAFYQVATGGVRTTGHMTAVKQVQNAGYWVSHDAQATQEPPVIVKDSGQLVSITLTWTDWKDRENEVVYNFEDMPGGELKQLERTHSKTGETPETGIMAQWINPDPAMTDCFFADTDGDDIEETLIFRITVVVGDSLPETREYRVVPRPL